MRDIPWQRVIDQANRDGEFRIAARLSRVLRGDGSRAPRPGPSSRLLFDTEDAREGVASFLERRSTRFVGR